MAQIEIERTILAPVPLLWHYLSTAEGLSLWHADEVTGDIESRRFVIGWPNLGARMELKVESYDPLRQITLRAGQSRVVLSLSHGGVHLVHSGLEEDDDLLGFESSWALALALLEHCAVKHGKTKRYVSWFFETIEVPSELAHYYFSTQVGLSRWLGDPKGDLGPVGSDISLALDGAVLRGKVLSHVEGRDLALSWQEEGESVLVLRTLPAAMGGRTLAVSFSSYGQPAPPKTLARLSQATLRLREAVTQRGVS